MPGNEGHVVAQGPELLGNRIDQILMIAARKIGATDRSLKQDIAHHGQSGRLMIENHMTGRMAGTVDHVEDQFTHRHLIAIFEPAIRLEAFRDHAVTRAITVKLVDPEAVVLVRTLDRNAKLFGQHPGLSAMVEMPVGDDDLLQINTMLIHRSLEPRKIATRIAERGLVGLGAPKKCAVLLERGDRNDHGLEGCICHEKLFGDNTPKLQPTCCQSGQSRRPVQTTRPMIFTLSALTSSQSGYCGLSLRMVSFPDGPIATRLTSSTSSMRST